MSCKLACVVILVLWGLRDKICKSYAVCFYISRIALERAAIESDSLVNKNIKKQFLSTRVPRST